MMHGARFAALFQRLYSRVQRVHTECGDDPRDAYVIGWRWQLWRESFEFAVWHKPIIMVAESGELSEHPTLRRPISVPMPAWIGRPMWNAHRAWRQCQEASR